MRKIFTTLSLAVLLTAGPAFADQVELEALTKAGVVLNVEQSGDILNARGEADTAAAMAKLVGSWATTRPADEAAVMIKAAVNTMVNIHPSMAEAIVSATSAALADFPHLVATVVEAAVAAAPNQSKSIANAAKTSVPGASLAIDNAVSNALSSVIYKQQNSPRNTPQPENNRNSRNDPASLS
ncbi:hypothetical protein [Zobellella aerophila]|uniref:Uncharacterized protein n=1 Tax=Zobellella aerophila TaxID=870480 RepID=A0ABP6VIX1_9GAMM